MHADSPPPFELLDRLVAAARALAPNEPVPCFAHMRLTSGERTRDYLLGWKTAASDDVTVLHWQHAPLATVFFSTPVGSDYELEIEGRTLEGRVTERHLLTCVDGALVVVEAGRRRWTRDGANWRLDPHDVAPLLRARELSRRERPISAVEVPLDETQRRAVRRAPGDAMLVLGEAGAGKTTVALHRVAHLWKLAHGAGRKFRGLVLVPTEGLRRLSQTLIERLGIPPGEVAVAMFDRWARGLARSAFRGVPLRESVDAPASVLHVKRHRALRVALERFAHARYGGRKPRRHVSRDDLLHLFGDRVLLEAVAAESSGTVEPRMVNELIAHTRLQFSETTEEIYSDVIDASRLESVDGRALESGTPMEDAGSIDAEDYPVMFELDRLRASIQRERAPALGERYDCIVVDEAQELAPLELALVGRAIHRTGTLVVAGDAGQQLDATACFASWSTTMRDLDAGAHEITRLETIYRSPPAVTALARSVLDPRDARATPVLEPACISVEHPANECHLVARLVDALRDIHVDDPRASVAVIARTPEAAKRLHALISRGNEAWLALDGDFHFGAGVNVTAVEEVKGLEFDLVLVPDANRSAYPELPESRRALYVAITRTIDRVALASVGSWSELIPRALQCAGAAH